MLDALKSLREDPGDLREVSDLLMAEVRSQDYQIQKLRAELAGHRNARFGLISESLDQLTRDLVEDIELATAAEEQKSKLSANRETKPKRQHNRKPLLNHLERRERVLLPDETCTCGNALPKVGEDVTDKLEYLPSRFVVIRFVHPRMACTKCERSSQVDLPSRPIEPGRPGPGLLAHVLVGRYGDHLPLDQQSKIYARENVDLYRSTRIYWIWRGTARLEPLVDNIGAFVKDGPALFVNDSPVKLYTKAKAKKTHTARLWSYVRDERTGSDIAMGAIERIAKLYAVEKMARGKPAASRAALRTEHARPISSDLETWLTVQLPKISGKTKLAEAIRYALGRLPKANTYLSDGRLEPDNNICEHSFRPVALGRESYFFMGSVGGGKAAAVAYTLIETAKMNSGDPEAWLTWMLERLPDHKINRLNELMSWVFGSAFSRHGPKE